MACLDENTVDLFVQGKLGEGARAQVDGHIAECQDCRLLISQLMHGESAQAMGAPAPARPLRTLTMVSRAMRAPVGQPLFSAGECVGDRYRVIRRVGEGGMGEVYEAEDLELRARVALKTVRPEIASDPRVIDRFRREIALARKVTHPNVCRIFDLGYHGRVERATFLTMEFLAGETLAQRIRTSGKLTPKEVLPILTQMAAGLAAAHEAGVVHRDFKSQNVMLVGTETQPRVVITDFGLARGAPTHEEVGSLSTGANGLVGSPAYMAPEQVAGLEVDARADQYALGVVLYEMLTGTWPFLGETPMLTAVKRLQERPPSPRVHVPELDEVWESVILRCLERDPKARFASVREVPLALERVRKEIEPVSFVGKRIGNYLIEEELGRGDIANLYLARHPTIERRIAVKLLHPHLSRESTLLRRFLDEAKASSAIHHAHIADIFDVGELEGAAYVTMEHLAGSNLADALERGGPFSIERMLHVVKGIGEALSAAHERGLVHRDLKPENIFLVERDGDRDFVKVLDFGIAEMKSGGGSSARYRAPEQTGAAPRSAVDPRADLYTLGLLSYQLLTGVLPSGDPVRPPSAHRPGLPAGLDDAIRRAIARQPDDRFPTVRAFLSALEAGNRVTPEIAKERVRERWPLWTAIAVLPIAAIGWVLVARSPRPSAPVLPPTVAPVAPTSIQPLPPTPPTSSTAVPAPTPPSAPAIARTVPAAEPAPAAPVKRTASVAAHPRPEAAPKSSTPKPAALPKSIPTKSVFQPKGPLKPAKRSSEAKKLITDYPE